MGSPQRYSGSLLASLDPAPFLGGNRDAVHGEHHINVRQPQDS